MIEAIKKFLGAIDSARTRIEAGSSSSEDVPLPFGGTVQMSASPGGAVRMTFSESGSVVSRLYNPGPKTRPSDYPADFPFLEGVSVNVLEMPDEGLRTLSWIKVTQTVHLAARVAAQMTEGGWVARPSRGQLFGVLGSETEFRKGRAVRRLVIHRIPGRPAQLRLIEKVSANVAAEST